MDIRKRIQEISTLIENQLILEKIELLKKQIGDIKRDKVQINNQFEKLLENHSEILAISIWNPKYQWETQIVQKEIWSDPQFINLDIQTRSTLLNHLLNRQTIHFKGDKFYHVDHLIWENPQKNPWMNLSYRYQTLNENYVIATIFNLCQITPSFGSFLYKGEKLSFIDHTERIFYISIADSSLENQTAQSNQNLNYEIYTVRKSFTNLPWDFVYQYSVLKSNSFYISPIKIIGVLAGGILLIWILSIGLAKWIDKPLIPLIETAKQIGRGNFDLRIPEQKSQKIHRLARLMNYMVEEMDHLQKINVSQIINEKNKTETILKNIADGVVVTDYKNRILIFNLAAEKWFGLREQDLFRKPIQECIKNQKIMSLLKELKDGRERSSIEFTYQTTGSSKISIFQARAARVLSPVVSGLGVVMVIRDITLEREADNLKNELVSMVAHELKTPLTSIYGYSEMLSDPTINDIQIKKYSEIILDEAGQLNDFVNKFLDISRLESGSTELQMISFDLDKLIEKMLASFKNQTKKKNIQVITEISQNLPKAFGDPILIEKVLDNLYNNAIKYSLEGSQVGIEVTSENDHLLVHVIDNGIGISKEALPKIFKKFYRANKNKEEENVGGSGLGLALVKEIIERHGGTINVKSTVGIGSVFSFTINKGPNHS